MRIISLCMPRQAGFHRMQAYSLAREFHGVVVDQCARRDWREAHLLDQLLRASSSICLNIAEGAGEFSSNEKVRFYRMARRSVWECEAAIDLLTIRRLRDRSALERAVPTLESIAALLTTMIVRRAPSASTNDTLR